MAESLVLETHVRELGLYARYVKPGVDRVVGSVALLLAAPILCLVAAAVWLTLGSPVFLRQERVGQHGRVFAMWKFRTMLPDRRRRDHPPTGEDRRRVHKSADDPRHTRLGRWLRTWSLDELPQLLNVVSGEMSLVGPRPELPYIVARYAPHEHERHLVRPGITGLWQVTQRGTLMCEHVDVDLEYIRSLSWRTDARILRSTLRAAVARDTV